jgi:hypothetical protein
LMSDVFARIVDIGERRKTKRQSKMYKPLHIQLKI